jgi:protein-histidine pros-kinase
MEETLVPPELYVRLIEALQYAVVVAGEDGRVVVFNREAELLWGYHRSEVVGRRLERLMPDRFQERHREHRAAYSEEPHARPMGTDLDLDLVAMTKTGEEIQVEISISPIQTPSGRFDAAIVRRRGS